MEPKIPGEVWMLWVVNKAGEGFWCPPLDDPTGGLPNLCFTSKDDAETGASYQRNHWYNDDAITTVRVK